MVFLPFQNGWPSGALEDFLTGFIADAANLKVYGRPVGVAVLPSGSLLAADDEGNKVWHVRYAGRQKGRKQKSEKMGADLIAEEQARHVETVAGSPIAVTSYRLGSIYYAKAEIALPGAGARIAQAQGASPQEVESKVLLEVRRILEKKA